LDFFLNLFITGLLQGGIYVLIATGIVVIYKATSIFNFAQGTFVAIGSFVLWSCLVQFGLSPVVGIIVTAVAGLVFGLLVERLIMRRMIGQPLLTAIMVTLALTYLLAGLTVSIWGASPRKIPAIFPNEPLLLGTIPISQELLWSFILAIAIFGAFTLFFQRSLTGLKMRAVAEDQQLAQSVGIGVKGIFAISWAISVGLAAIGGFFLGGLSGAQPALADISLKCFPVVLLGGLESITGTLVGGLVIGISESMAAGYIDPLVGGGIGDIVPYVILMIILVVRPSGLFGMKRIERI
jgi:branched-chain amino acid transport system permease protein